MKIVIPVNEDKKSICISFGRAPLFLVLDNTSEERSTIDNSANAEVGGAGIKAAQALIDANVEVVLTPRCGENAIKLLHAAQISVYKTLTEDVEKALEAYFEGKLEEL